VVLHFAVTLITLYAVAASVRLNTWGPGPTKFITSTFECQYLRKEKKICSCLYVLILIAYFICYVISFLLTLDHSVLPRDCTTEGLCPILTWSWTPYTPW
jgi:hypothetical protein